MNIEKSDVPSITKGYKRTDIGVIPEDWEVKILNDKKYC